MTDLFDTMTCPHCAGTGKVFAHAPTARASDPDTSQAAGRRQESDVRVLRPGTKRWNVLRSLSMNGPQTAQEVALSLHDRTSGLGNIEGTRRRMSDLVKAGYAVDSGKRRENPGSGTHAIVYEVTLAGVFALEAAS